MLDYELELGAVIGDVNELGEPVSIANARERIAGLTIVNDWSARDVQKWEYQPLGPFLAKNFATSIAPYITPIEALEPFRCALEARASGDPAPLPYLFDETDQREGGFDIRLEVLLRTRQMREADAPAHTISRGNFRHMYWTFAQMVAHHTCNGCNLMPGDLLASGTISGPETNSRGCLLELSWDGIDPANNKPKPRKPLLLPTGEQRTFLQDGDEVTMRAVCERAGYRTISLGEVVGVIEG
jgi:fumarylacetoacetase